MKSRRIRILSGEDGLLGGDPPKGIAPRDVRLSYFATIRTGGKWLSIFVASDYGWLLQSLEFRRIVRLPPSIELHWHDSIEERRPSRFRSGLSPHSLRIDPEIDDTHQGRPRMRSKLGGSAFTYADGPIYLRELERAHRMGFSHYVQIGFAGGPDDDLVEGDWPFGDRLTSFFRHEKDPDQWQVFWRGL